MLGKLIHGHLWGPSPFRFGGGRRSHEEQIEAKHTSSLPSFGPHGCIKPYCCSVVCIEVLLGSAECYSTHQQLTRPSVSAFLIVLPPLRCAWASFYMLKGSPT